MRAKDRIRLACKLGLLGVVTAALALPGAGAAAPTEEVKKITASDADNQDEFGGSVAVEGGVAIVGAQYEAGGGFQRGAAYVFQKDQGGADNWGEVKKLIASDAQNADWFGFAVGVSGETAIVGAPLEEGAGSDRGAAYIFQRDRGGVDSWGEVKKLAASDSGDFDRFGNSVAIAGDTAIIGAIVEGGDRGAAYVFGRNEGGADNWGEVKKLTASDAQLGDEFGISVAVSGGTAIIGAWHEDGTGGSNADRGAAYVFGRDQGGPDNWGEMAKLTASDTEDHDSFGNRVGINGDTAVVGAISENGGGSARGASYLFDRNQGGPDSWGEVKKLTASDTEDLDYFGSGVAISGPTVIVGARLEDGPGGPSADRGAAYVFRRDEGGANNWGELKKLSASDGNDGDGFGNSVGISADMVIVGARFQDGVGVDRGAAYIFGPFVPVGGVAELPGVDGTALQTGGSSGPGAALIAGIAAAIAAGLASVGVAAWYLKRRRAP